MSTTVNTIMERVGALEARVMDLESAQGAGGEFLAELRQEVRELRRLVLTRLPPEWTRENDVTGPPGGSDGAAG